MQKDPAEFLLQAAVEGGGGVVGSERATGKLTYVMGSSSRMYEEKCVAGLWPHLDVAKTLAMQLEASPLEQFELEHIEVLLASLPPQFYEEEAGEWLSVFEKVKQYIFVALVDSDLHRLSAEVVQHFWLSSVETISSGSVESSKKTLLQALRLLYTRPANTMVDEAAVVQFLRDMRNHGGNLAVEINSVIESFRETFPAEHANSRLGEVLA